MVTISHHLISLVTQKERLLHLHHRVLSNFVQIRGLYIMAGSVFLLMVIITIVGLAVNPSLKNMTATFFVFVVIVPIFYGLLIIALAITYLFRFILGINDTREDIRKLPISPERKAAFDKKYFRFMVGSFGALVLSFILNTTAVLVTVWNYGNGIDVVRPLNVLVTIAFNCFICIMFRANDQESLQLYIPSNNFEIHDDSIDYEP